MNESEIAASAKEMATNTFPTFALFLQDYAQAPVTQLVASGQRIIAAPGRGTPLTEWVLRL